MRARALPSALLAASLALLGSFGAAPAAAQPAAADDFYTVNEDTLLNPPQGVRANDQGTLLGAALVDAPPINGTLVLSPDGSFTYQPAANFNGVDTFTYRLTSLFGDSNIATVTITVNSVNDAPTGAVNRSYSTNEGVPLTVAAPGVLTGVTDVDGDAVSAALVTNVAAAAGTLALNPNGSFTYTPAAGFSGNATFTYRAVDNGAPPQQTAPATVTITVVDVNDPPVANADTYTATEDTNLTVGTRAAGVLGNDTDPDTGQTVTAVLATPPAAAAGTLTLNANGSFTFRPTPNFSGVTSFTYRARDNGTPPLESAPATVTITINAVNDPPVGVADAYETTENAPLSVPAPGVLGNDTDVDSTAITAVLVQSVQASRGTVSLNANGSFVFTPAPGYSGPATFTYRALDNATPASQSAITTVTITVRAVNDPPVAAPNTYAATEDTVLTVPAPGVLGNDTDPDTGTTLTAVLATPPAHGTLTLNANGSFTYSPAADYHGPDSFTYRARDNGTPRLESAAATVTINVAAADDPPRLAPNVTAIPSQTATEAVAFGPLTLAQYFVDPEGAPLTFTVTGLPAGLTATPAGVVAGTPQINLPTRNFTVNVVVSDGAKQLTTTFPMLVLAAGRTDLAVTGTAEPSPALIGQPIAWAFVIENRSTVENVGNLALEVVFTSPPAFTLGATAGCTATPRTGGVTATCTAGPILAGGKAAITLTGSSTQPGDVSARATVKITDIVPIDATPENDTVTLAVNIAETLAAGPAQTLQAVGHRASAAGDFDGDGFVDLAIAAESGAGTLIYPNVADPSAPGNGKRVLSTQAIPLGDAGASTDITVADVDRDGAVDLIVAKASGPSIVLRNPKDGTFSFTPLGSALGAATDKSNAVAAGDLDGDGNVDVTLGNSSPNRVFKNQGNGSFTQIGALGNDDTRDAVFVNLAGDAALELVFANANRGATVYSYDAATGAFRETLLSFTGATTSVDAADLNGDGRIDLVFGRAQSKIVLFNATPPGGALTFGAPLELGAAPTADVLTADTDADGDVDIIGINTSGSHQIYANDSRGQFTLRPQQFASKDARSATAAKLSLDDRIDVAVVGTASLEVFWNDGAGNLGKGDVGAPTITLVGQPSVELTVESTYTDPGATATDAVDGDLTAKIKVDNPVNTAVVGTYTVTYTVVDSSGNAAAPVRRTVTVGVRSGTGGGGGGAVDVAALLALAALALLAHLRFLTHRRNAS